jgi:hypothetical protein
VHLNQKQDSKRGIAKLYAHQFDEINNSGDLENFYLILSAKSIEEFDKLIVEHEFPDYQFNY